jgi:uncharacterized protein (DUF1800 family)
MSEADTSQALADAPTGQQAAPTPAASTHTASSAKPSIAPLPGGPSHLSALLATTAASLALSACGGGSDPTTPSAQDSSGAGTGDSSSGTMATAAALPLVATDRELDAWRFLNQATFGPTLADIDKLKTTNGYTQWLATQFGMGQSASLFKMTQASLAKIGPLYGGDGLHREHTSSAWWEKALTAPDQLRARVAFALSEILVIGMSSGGLAEWPYCAASYYDVLLDGAFGNFKDLLTKVSGHPAMGLYLSHLGNKKPTVGDNHIPDQNFAREILQLFSIGLYKLKMDGTPVLDAAGKPIETYTQYDIEVLSHVFTGWSWVNADFGAWFGRLTHVDSQTSQMKGFTEFHSGWAEFPKLQGTQVLHFPDANAGDIKLLGQPLNISATPNPEADRQAALDIIVAHPNVAPFIAKQMIQRLVTSNPSAGYVSRVAQSFKASGLSLKALVQAILLDKEARDVATVRLDPTYGKLREPILRVTQYLRAFTVKSVGNVFAVNSVAGLSSSGDPHNCLGQAPLESPSVFNYFRPGYVAPNTAMGTKGLVLPEMQICSETDVAAYARFMEDFGRWGFGHWVDTTGHLTSDAAALSEHRSVYASYADEYKVLTDTTTTTAVRAAKLIDLLNRKLFGGAMSAGLKAHLLTVSDSVPYDTDLSLEGYCHKRIVTLALLCAISPEYVVQR